ncbi:MAG TPA: hypothetical protein PK878_13630 [bacterium]|nr:hypothetical protein [bacterium]HPP00262.1 hypothetical protein [bacterium]
MTRGTFGFSSLMPRRQFGLAMGTIAGGLWAGPGLWKVFAGENNDGTRGITPAKVRGAFLYPPTTQLRQEGYYSWPGSSFDAEGRHAQYLQELRIMERDLGMHIEMEDKPLDLDDSVQRFIRGVRESPPDGLLLIPFKKSHFEGVRRILDETSVPAVVFATQGILLNAQIQSLRERPGVYLINSLDNLDAVRRGMTMIRAARRMKDTLIVNIDGADTRETEAPPWGTRIRTIPHQRFYSAFQAMSATDEVQRLAREYLRHAVRRVEPSEEDVLDAAKTYFVFKQILESEQAGAVMMNCLPGLREPHQHVPPCMGFMSLRDEGIPAGCESDLDATLTMLLIQALFDRPGFQHNPSMDTEKNRYFGAHCTCASRMGGPDRPPEPYILRNHAEAGWGCVPQVLFPIGQEVTFTKLLSRETPPQMLVYSGKIVGCPPNPPTGGCRTNVELELDELDDACGVKGHHLCLFYGRHARDLRIFCQLHHLQAVS